MQWLFGGLAIIFLVISFISIFLFGSKLFWVSDKSNNVTHLFLLFAGLSLVIWFYFAVPEKKLEALFCILPIVLFTVGIAYFSQVFFRKTYKKFSRKTGFNNPFEPKPEITKQHIL